MNKVALEVSGESSSRHLFDNDFSVSREQKEQFQRDGFVKLDGFLNSAVVDMLLDRIEFELARDTSEALSVDAQFSRAKYDFVGDKMSVYELLERPYVQQALTGLTERDLFLTFELSFELERNVNKGFPWHVGVQSFGYQFLEQFGCTLWAPLHPVDTSKQRGGLACVPQHVISGEFAYDADIAIVEVVRARERAGKKTGVKEFFELRKGILNSPCMAELLEVHEVEYDFEPGDVLLFNKSVIHRSIMLGEGDLPSRAAHVMRLVDAGSRYDLNRAKILEFPAERYGKGFFPFKPLTRQHIEIAEAGAENDDLLSECAYFKDKERRMIRRVHADS